jgi:hypothetical protein
MKYKKVIINVRNKYNFGIIFLDFEFETKMCTYLL